MMLMLCFCRPVLAQQTQPPAPIERRTPSQAETQARGEGHHTPRGEHLAEWMNQHSSLTPQQQQDALSHEPGFQQLPSQTQQRMRDRLAQLDAMDPQRRQRLLVRNEAMERLNPDQRAEVRGAMAQLGALPIDERRVVARTFHALAALPPEQRMSEADSGQYGPPLNSTQRATLFQLLHAEPLLGPMLLPPAPQPHPQGGMPVQTLR